MLSFGSPLYDTTWVMDESKSFLEKLNRTTYDNYFLSSRRLVLPNDIDWKHSTKWPAEKSADAEGDDGYSLVNVSDIENEVETIKHLRVRKRNKRLRSTKKDDSIQILSIKQPLISEKTLETLWKLYRNAGETIEDLIRRLVDMPSAKTEFCIRSDDNYDVKNMMAGIKDEVLSGDESFYSENESAEKEEEDSERDSKKVKDMIHLKNIPTNKIKLEKSKSTDCDSICEHPLCLSEILVVEIQESEKIIQFPCDLEVDSIKEECTKDLTFKAPTLRASESPVGPISNCTYAVPRLKQIANAELVVTNKIITRSSRNKNAGVKIDVKKEISSNDDESAIRDPYAKLRKVKPQKLKKRISSCEDDEPIIKEMHGVRTRSYNTRASKVKIPTFVKISELSDNEEIEFFDQFGWKGLSAAGNSSVKRETEWNSSDNFLSKLTVNLSSDSDISELEKRNVKKRKLSTIKAKNFQNKPKKSKSSETSSSSCSSSCTCTRSPCSRHSYYTRSSCSCSSSSTSSTISDEKNNDE